jgi:hypothetical protein
MSGDDVRVWCRAERVHVRRKTHVFRYEVVRKWEFLLGQSVIHRNEEFWPRMKHR